MTLRPIESAQHTAAKVAGCLYVVIILNAISAEFFLRAPLLVRGDAVRTASNIAASEWLFLISTVSSLMTVAGNVVLLVALYVVLKPINRHVALVAALWRLIECAIFAVTALNDFVALSLLSGSDYLRAFDTTQLQALARMFITMRHVGGQIGAVFLGLGSTLFAYLWLKSRYIPRGLAAWGILSSLLLTIGILGIMVFPRLVSAVSPTYWLPTLIFEVILGFWLLIKGLRVPDQGT